MRIEIIVGSAIAGTLALLATVLCLLWLCGYYGNDESQQDGRPAGLSTASSSCSLQLSSRANPHTRYSVDADALQQRRRASRARPKPRCRTGYESSDSLGEQDSYSRWLQQQTRTEQQQGGAASACSGLAGLASSKSILSSESQQKIRVHTRFTIHDDDDNDDAEQRQAPWVADDASFALKEGPIDLRSHPELLAQLAEVGLDTASATITAAGSGDGGDGGDAAAHTPSSSTLAFHGSQALTPPPTRPPAPSARTLTRIPPAPVPACLPLPPALRSPPNLLTVVARSPRNLRATLRALLPRPILWPPFLWPPVLWPPLLAAPLAHLGQSSAVRRGVHRRGRSTSGGRGASNAGT